VEAFYQAVAPGKPVAVPGSSGFVEIAVNGGNASQILKLKTGSKVTILH
jgi:S-adenosylmethionine hydrolase